MSELKGACIIGQSGGPTSVINASAYGVIRTALDSDCITNVYGAEHGIKGVLEDRLFDMSQEDPKELELLKYTPSSALGSCRYKMKDPDEDDTDYKRILEVFKKHDVRYFFYNGGNDSMDTCNKISKYMQKVGYECRVMGVPKTIDNDLYGTDHCPGYASAAKYIATSLMEVYQDAHVYDTGMICIVEIMGRHAGWLTAAAALATKYGAGPDLIYLPETDFDMDTFLADVQRVYKETGSCMVAVSEGIHYADGSFVSEAKTSATDGFGHAQLGGLAALLASIVKEKTGYELEKEKLRNYTLENFSFLTTNVQTFVFDNSGTLWIGCYGDGLFYSKDRLKTLHPYRSPIDNKETYANDVVISLAKGAYNCLYVGSLKGGVKELNLTSNKLHDLLLADENGESVFCRELLMASDNELWIGAESGLYIYNLRQIGRAHV